MNELIIMSIPDVEKPWFVYDKTLRRGISKNSHKTYEEAEGELKQLLKTGMYWSKVKSPSGEKEFEQLVNRLTQANTPDKGRGGLGGDGGTKRF